MDPIVTGIALGASICAFAQLVALIRFVLLARQWQAELYDLRRRVARLEAPAPVAAPQRAVLVQVVRSELPPPPDHYGLLN